MTLRASPQCVHLTSASHTIAIRIQRVVRVSHKTGPPRKPGQVHPTASSSILRQPEINANNTPLSLCENPVSADFLQGTPRVGEPSALHSARAPHKAGQPPRKPGQVHPTASSSILRQPEINTKNTLLPPKVMRSAATGSILGLSARTAQKCRRPGSPHSKQLNPSPTRDQYKKHSASAEGNEIRGDGIHFGTLGTHRPKVSPPRFTPQQEADALEMRKSTH
jgi:hypothetical protein